MANRTDESTGDDDLQLPAKVKSNNSSPSFHSNGATTITSAHNDSIIDNNVDFIFVKITELYSQEDYTIIYHTLLKIQNDPQYYLNYIEGLNKILEPVNIRIKKWIDDNIVF
jgi:hypothetical protein